MDRHGPNLSLFDDFSISIIVLCIIIRIFIAIKKPSSSAGFEPANLGFGGKHATTRPPISLVAVLTSSAVMAREERLLNFSVFQ
jgi:hypothetical protein